MDTLHTTDALDTGTRRGAPARRAGGGLDACIAAAQAHLLGLQDHDGSWCAELEGDTILESEYVLTMVFLGRMHEDKVRKAANQIRNQQRLEGGWAIYPGGPVDPSASVKAYFVLKLLGDDPDAPHMAKARQAILEAGGLEACNSYTKIYLAIFGQYEWSRCPAIPPEIVLFPSWFPFNIYEMSSWSRAIVVPLSIIWAHKPHCEVPAHADITELRVGGHDVDITKYTGCRILWTHFFAAADRFVKLLETSPWKPQRKKALREAERWVVRRLEKSDGIGAIIPPIINTIIGFLAMGHDVDHPVVAGQIRELERLEIEDGETLRVQPCFSVLWDTVQVMNALLAADVDPAHPALQEAARWVLDHEVKDVGDWKVKVPDAQPGGWYFEYANEFYPDCDDTAEVLTALAQVRFDEAHEAARCRGAMARAMDWLRHMQNVDGGWAAFDKGCTKTWLTHVPFADHNAMLDPSCEDITARVLEAMAALGFDRHDPAAARGIQFLRDTQEPDGTWYGRWGCNYIYGTWLALWGLRCMGEDLTQPRYRRAGDWFVAHQNEDGGWGESPASYDDPSTKGVGPSTAAQTAWALIALLALGRRDDEAARRGLAYLADTQRVDGSWQDEPWTGTGFPRVFYLRYHLYATQFPLLAMALYRRGDGALQESAS